MVFGAMHGPQDALVQNDFGGGRELRTLLPEFVFG
jgi:hypothetical protein